MIDIDKKKDCSVLHLQGAFAGMSFEELQRHFDDLKKEGCNKIILDLKEVSYMNSTSIAAVCSHFRDVEAEGGQLVISNTPPNVMSMFKLLGVDRFIKLTDSEKDAENELNK